MMRGPRRAVLAAVALTALGATGCTDIESAMARVPILNFMHESPAFDPYEAPRDAPPNAVPVESPGEQWEPPVEPTEAGLNEWGNSLTNPLPMSDSVVNRGAAVFATYCAVCHGVTAQGDGPIVGGGKFPLATNLTLPTTVDRSDGYIYAIVRVGRGLMPSYKRIPPHDRWAVVNYVRHLQQTGEPIQVAIPGTVQPGYDQFNTAPPPDAGAASGAAPTDGAGAGSDTTGREQE